MTFFCPQKANDMSNVYATSIDFFLLVSAEATDWLVLSIHDLPQIPVVWLSGTEQPPTALRQSIDV